MSVNSVGPLICSFSQYILQNYMICSWLNPWAPNRGYKGLTMKLYMAFQLHRGGAHNPYAAPG